VDEVGELDGVANEEHRGVVADDVVVALGRVEAERIATDVAPGVGGSLLAGNGRVALQHFALGARLEHGRAGVLRHVFGDLELTECATALGVRVALRDALTVERGELLDQVTVVQRGDAVGPRRERVFVARDRRA